MTEVLRCLPTSIQAGYRGEYPVVGKGEREEAGLPTTIEGILDLIEQRWLGIGEGISSLVERHIDGEVLTLRRGSTTLRVRAFTRKDSTPCPINWGITLEGEDRVIEPTLFVPEGEEVRIEIGGEGVLGRLGLLGAYDRQFQIGTAPIRVPLLQINGRASLYVGEQKKVEVVFWEGDKWGYLRVQTAVRRGRDNQLEEVQRGSSETPFYGGLYLIVVPERNFYRSLPLRLGLDPLFHADEIDRLMAREGGIWRGLGIEGGVKGFSNARAGSLFEGELVGRGSTTSFEPDLENLFPFILRVAVIGDRPSYLRGGSLKREEIIVVRGAICAYCGRNAPSEAYQWKGNEFTPFDFQCRGCGGTILEPVLTTLRR